MFDMLSFSALVITGPSTASTSIALNLAGQLAVTGIKVRAVWTLAFQGVQPKIRWYFTYKNDPFK